MKYKEFLNVNDSFQYSINLQYDLENEKKLQGYIPTRQSLKVLEEYLKSILLDNNDKSTVLIGPYGKGKSHLLLLLMSLIGDAKISSQTQNEILEKISYVNRDTEKLIREIFKKQFKFLPIIVNSSTLDLNQAFLVALNEAIENRELKELRLKTYYDTVIDIIKMWEKEYKGALDILSKELKSLNYELKDLIDGLKNYRTDAYQVFINIYPKISSGIEFNPMSNTNIVKIYEELNYILCEKYNYNGIFIIFDEFSKFIEGSALKSTSNSKDMKILQDFAELANRSKNTQLHLACVTHKSINEYISKIPANKIDSWRAIEGRFKEIYFTSSTKQNYELIKNTIIANEDEVKKLINNNESIKNVIDRSFEVFQEYYTFDEYNKMIATGCFPLNPLATYVLPIISEKVAQNERTLFTFISKDEQYTLCDFINKCNEEKLLEMDIIYDYFENLFKKEFFNDVIKNIWIKCDVAIKKAKSNIQIKILKALAIIYIVNDFENLSPSENTLALCCGFIDINRDLNILKEENIIMRKKSSGLFNFMPISYVNINQKIQDTINTKFKNIVFSKEIEKLINPRFVLPRKYNDNYKMIRYFKNIFMTFDLLEAYDKGSLLLNHYDADGLIVNLIYKTEEDILKAKNTIDKLNNKRIFLKIPNLEFNHENNLLELLAIKHLKNDTEFLSEDSCIIEQLNLLEEDLETNINEYIKTNFDIESANCKIYSVNENRSFTKEKQFNRFLSEICEEVFKNTVVINNELINKNQITTPILKARNKIVEGLLNKNLEFEGKGPEVTIYRATLLNKGLIDSRGIDKDIELVLKEIKNFLLICTNEKLSFSVLYNNLLSDAIGMGLRKGSIPIYLAYVFKEYSDELIIYYGNRGSKELEFTIETLNNINDNPKDYFLKVDKSSKEKEEYLDGLSFLFCDFINDKKFVKNKYVEIFKGMQAWIQSLDKYTRTHLNNPSNNNDEIPKEITILRKELVKFDVNARAFIFDKIQIILKTNSFNECINKLRNIKTYLDNFNLNIEQFLIKDTRSIIAENYKGSLSQGIKIWLSQLEDYKVEHLYDNITNNFINYVKFIDTNNDNDIVRRLALILTGLNIEDWNDSTLEEYRSELNNVLNIILKFEVAITEDDDKSFNITLENSNQDNVYKNFKKQEISLLGNALMNDLQEIFDEYGESIDDNEKRNILAEMLKKYM